MGKFPNGIGVPAAPKRKYKSGAEKLKDSLSIETEGKREVKQPDRLTIKFQANSQALVAKQKKKIPEEKGNPSASTPVPKTLKEAKESGFWKGFEKAIETEVKAIEEQHTWEYVDWKDIPKNRNILRSKFVFDIKSFIKYKARMVAMGFTQVEGVDFFDTTQVF
jgi:hypothetical protein